MVPPVGWVGFCKENPSDCNNVRTKAHVRRLSAKDWQELYDVHRLVNSNVKPITDKDHYGVLERWAYPDDGYGDCEDYVLLKRKLLIARGWHPSTLLITIVRDENGDGHAVLTVVTDSADFIVDNMRDAILPWWETKYIFLRRQSVFNQTEWRDLSPNYSQTPVVSVR